MPIQLSPETGIRQDNYAEQIRGSDSQRISDLNQKVDSLMRTLEARESRRSRPALSAEIFEEMRRSNIAMRPKIKALLEESGAVLESSDEAIKQLKETIARSRELCKPTPSFLSILLSPFINFISLIKSLLRIN